MGTFLAQFHPLFGPQLSNESARIIMRNWTVSVFDLTSNGYVNEDVMYTFTYICVNMYSRARVCWMLLKTSMSEFEYALSVFDSSTGHADPSLHLLIFCGERGQKVFRFHPQGTHIINETMVSLVFSSPHCECLLRDRHSEPIVNNGWLGLLSKRSERLYHNVESLVQHLF